MLYLYFSVLLTATMASPVNGPTAIATEKKSTKEVLKVYQTPHEEGCLTVRSTTNAPIQFYLFDSEGKLVYQSQMKHREELTVEGLLPGAYTYHAFRADEKLKGGTVDIKN